MTLSCRRSSGLQAVAGSCSPQPEFQPSQIKGSRPRSNRARKTFGIGMAAVDLTQGRPLPTGPFCSYLNLVGVPFPIYLAVFCFDGTQKKTCVFPMRHTKVVGAQDLVPLHYLQERLVRL